MVVPTAPSQNKLAQAFLCCALLVGKKMSRSGLFAFRCHENNEKQMYKTYGFEQA